MGREQLSRREFLAITSQMGLAASLGTQLYDSRAWSTPEQVRAILQPIIEIEIQKGPVYRGEFLEHIGFPLGGIGTGSVALVGTGEVSEWQIWNRVHKPARIGQTFFALSGNAGDKSFQRVLQTRTCEDLPEVEPMKALSFRGEYPVAWLDFEDDLPLDVSLESYSPMIPLEPEMSAFPLAAFNWKLKNTSDRKVAGYLLASLQNAVGQDGFSQVRGNQFYGYGRNKVKTIRSKKGVGLYFDAQPGEVGTFGKSTVLATNDPQINQIFQTARNVNIHYNHDWRRRWIPLPASTLKAGVNTIWLGNVDRLNWGEPSSLMALAEAVKEGANLVLTGGEKSALPMLLAPPVAEEGTVLLADFEGEEYAPGWRVEGEAFGTGPAKGTFLPHQNPVTGYIGLGLVNSYKGNDDLTGKLISPEFDLSKPFLQFLVAGGSSSKTEIRLIVDGQIVRREAGLNNEYLRRRIWNISEFVGKKGHLEIVDEGVGGWGHINVDDIRLSDSEVMSFTQQEAQILFDLLPFKAKSYQCDPSKPENISCTHPLFRSCHIGRLRNVSTGSFDEFVLKDGADLIPGNEDSRPLGVIGAYGKGKVLFLNPDLENVHPGDIEPFVGGIAAALSGNTYEPRSGWPRESPFFGDMTLGCLNTDGEALPVWTQKEDIIEFLGGRSPRKVFSSTLTRIGESFAGAIRVPYQLEPGEEKVISFTISWSFPNHYIQDIFTPSFRVGNYYNTLFKNSADSFEQFARNREKLEGGTLLFHDMFYRSTLPVSLLDCVSSQASILKSQTSMWLEDGTFAGWEGVVVSGGCCPMNCTHVYNYAQTMACLYPSLEREVRSKDLGIQLMEDGLIHHRLTLPLSEPRSSGEALDGQLGTILKLYREYRQCSDDSFLRKYWQPACKAMDFVFRNHDPQGDGVILDRQFNTYDDAVYGINPFIGTLYLAALRAMEEMARHMGNEDLAAQCHQRFEKGRERIVKECWNGEFFFQPGDLTKLEGRNYGAGCLSDQIVGQWWAHILNLGYLLPEDQVKTALDNLLKYNWLDKLGDHKQLPRVYAAPDDPGLLNCSWPNGGRPEIPILYCDEVWTGIEYQVAGHLLFEGKVDQGLHVVSGARSRSNGKKREGTHPSGVGNPWNEIECGDHYARAMSSYSLLLAAQGINYEGPRGKLGFNPVHQPEKHASFVALADGWGVFEQKIEGNRQIASLFLAYGKADLSELGVNLPAGVKSINTIQVTRGKDQLASETRLEGSRLSVALKDSLKLTAGERVTVEISWAT